MCTWYSALKANNRRRPEEASAFAGETLLCYFLFFSLVVVAVCCCCCHLFLVYIREVEDFVDTLLIVAVQAARDTLIRAVQYHMYHCSLVQPPLFRPVFVIAGEPVGSSVVGEKPVHSGHESLRLALRGCKKSRRGRKARSAFDAGIMFTGSMIGWPTSFLLTLLFQSAHCFRCRYT